MINIFVWRITKLHQRTDLVSHAELSLDSSFQCSLMFSLPWVMYLLLGFKTSRKLSAVWKVSLWSPHCSSFQCSALCTAGKAAVISSHSKRFQQWGGSLGSLPHPVHHPPLPLINHFGTPSSLFRPAFCIPQLDGKLGWHKENGRSSVTLPFYFDDLEPRSKANHAAIT